ncbi:right-handed parallel beta-helix repeat-containing protein [Corallococcus llansteffanensis]|uniref:Right-handed parallel beta-helix repeat-containing protein n=1 Tax=Corallococcus llansteffanensis TaxID=2316731 RepID=A0A3A8QKM3_9BACT|nr:right-handed parallel beta-helix repeat-containing protein [Corallococcus llansteffanensis]
MRLAGLLLLSTFGCVEEEPAFEVAPSGGVRLVVALPRSLEAVPVAAVTSTVTHGSGPEEVVPLALTPEGGAAWSGDVEPVSSGETVGLRVDALDGAGAVVATASLEEALPLSLQGEALVVMVPHPAGAVAGPGNTAPRIHAVVASKARATFGEEVRLRAWASDLEPTDTLTYAWSSSTGSLDCTGAECTLTVLPEPYAGLGSHSNLKDGLRVEVRVTDARGAVSTLQFRIGAGTVGAEGSLEDTRFNRWPVVPADGEPRPLAVGAPFLVPAATTDEDGASDPLTYAWTATCDGTFDDVTRATPVFTPTAEPLGCTCQLHGAVSDSFGGSVGHIVSLCVRQSAPPVLGATSQSAPSARAGERVTFTAAATDPRGEPLTFTWTTNAGAVGTAVGDGTTSTVDWTELSCVPPDVTPTVEVTVTNASGASVRHAFPVEWTDRRCGALAGACAFTLAPGKVSLSADCVTQGPVFVPDGFTFDGAGHTLTAVEDAAAGEHFQGAVLRNRGPVASVRGVTVTARSLLDVCDAGALRLRGILLEGATGAIEDSVVEALHQAGNLSGCQEGFAIEVRNDAAGAAQVTVGLRRNRVTGYQKAGLLVAGRVDVAAEDNVVEGGGPVGHIARVGIQLAYGVLGRVVDNEVTGNAYTPATDAATGILVVGGAGRPLCHDLLIQGNMVTENDIGISLSQGEGGSSAPSEATRIQVLENELSKDTLTNGEGPEQGYQVALFDNGGANLLSRNRISGDGYDPAVFPDEAFDVVVKTVGGERQVAFATPARTVDAGACSEALVVQGRDAAGNLASLVDPVVALAASDAGATFHLQPDCSDAAVALVSLAGAQREGVFYVRSGAAGVVTVTATGDGVSATQEQTVR